MSQAATPIVSVARITFTTFQPRKTSFWKIPLPTIPSPSMIMMAYLNRARWPLFPLRPIHRTIVFHRFGSWMPPTATVVSSMPLFGSNTISELKFQLTHGLSAFGRAFFLLLLSFALIFAVLKHFFMFSSIQNMAETLTYRALMHQLPGNNLSLKECLRACWVEALFYCYVTYHQSYQPQQGPAICCLTGH